MSQGGIYLFKWSSEIDASFFPGFQDPRHFSNFPISWSWQRFHDFLLRSTMLGKLGDCKMLSTGTTRHWLMGEKLFSGTYPCLIIFFKHVTGKMKPWSRSAILTQRCSVRWICDSAPSQSSTLIWYHPTTSICAVWLCSVLKGATRTD